MRKIFKSIWISTILVSVLLLVYFLLKINLFRIRQPREGICRGFNVVLITVDTLRADHLSFYGYPGMKDPNITKLAKEGTVFFYTFCSMPRTMPSHASIFTGLRPEQHMVFSNGFRLSNEYLTLAEVFKNEGYNTAAFVSSYPVDSKFGLNQGFDYYDDAEFSERDFQNLTDDERLETLRRRGDQTTNLAINWMQKNVSHAISPFFIWIHYWDVHKPYDAPGPYGSMYLEYSDLVPPDYLNQNILKYPILSSNERRSPYHEELMRSYEGGISYVDFQIGRLIDEIKSLTSKTLVIFTSDHGESFEHNVYGEHCLVLYNSALRIPLIFWSPEAIQHGKIYSIVESIDISSSLAYLHGWNYWPGIGKNLWARPQDSIAIASTYYFQKNPSENIDWTIINENKEERKIYKLICRAVRISQNRKNDQLKKSLELYEIKSDPFETQNIISLMPQVKEDLIGEWEEINFSDQWEEYPSNMLKNIADFSNWKFFFKNKVKIYKTKKGFVFELLPIHSKFNIILNKNPLKENFVLSAEIAAKNNSQTSIIIRGKNERNYLKIHTADNFSIASRYIKNGEIGKLKPICKFRLNDNKFHKLIIIANKYEYKILIDGIKIGEFIEKNYPVSNFNFGFGTRFNKIRIRNIKIMDTIQDSDLKIDKKTKEKLRALGYIR